MDSCETSPSATDCAYLAGFIDGEACIHVCGPGNVANFRVDIVNTDLAVLQWIQGQFGGSLFAIKSRESYHRPCWKLAFAGQPAYRVLQATIPYLRVKRAQALVALELGEYIRNCGSKSGRELLAEDKVKREEYRQRMIALKQRSTPPGH